MHGRCLAFVTVLGVLLAPRLHAQTPRRLSLADAVRAAMPVRSVSAREARELTFGRSIPPIGRSGTYAACAMPDGAVIALLEETAEKARPVLVFASAG